MRSPAFSRLLLSFWPLQFVLVLSSLAMQFPLLPTLGWGGWWWCLNMKRSTPLNTYTHTRRVFTIYYLNVAPAYLGHLLANFLKDCESREYLLFMIYYLLFIYYMDDFGVAIYTSRSTFCIYIYIYIHICICIYICVFATHLRSSPRISHAMVVPIRHFLHHFSHLDLQHSYHLRLDHSSKQALVCWAMERY
jgi:hypothetical protein